MPTKIEHLDETINPIQDKRKGKSGRGYHCTKISEGCLNCWAEGMNRRFGNGYPFDDTPVEFEIVQSQLDKLQAWKKPRRVGVQFMGDLFHKHIPYELQIEVLNALQLPHTYYLLTKRPLNMLHFFQSIEDWELSEAGNIHGGLTICNQQEADEKIPIFLQIPLAKHILSIEPMLGPINLHLGDTQSDVVWRRTHGGSYQREFIDWVILGGESGPGARPMHPDWVRSVRDQCQEAGVPFFFKQWGEWIPHSERFGGGLFIKPDGTRTCQGDYWDGHAAAMNRVGKKQAGRLLDGREWNATPKVIGG